MKGLNKKLLILISAVISAAVMTFSAAAAGLVTYSGNASGFIFSPGSEYSPTDLFTDFKGLMPGDSITQRITVNNSADKNIKIKLYMRSLGAAEGSESLLSQLMLNVKYAGTENMSELFSAPADESAQLTDWVYLGTVYSGGNLDLDVTLNVPLELENGFQNAIGYLDWQFKVEELPVEADDPKAPNTGDFSGTAAYVSLVCISVAVLAAALIKRKRDGRS